MARAALLLVFAIAIALRVGYFVEARAHNPTFEVQIADCAFYDAWAKRIADGEWTSDEAFYQPPLYPYLLGLLYRLLDALSLFDQRYAVAYALQMLMGLASLALVAAISHRLFGRAAAVLACALSVAYGELMFWELKLLATTLDIFLGLLTVHLLLRAVDRTRGFAWAGVSAGLYCLARADKLLFAALCGVFLLATHARGLRFRPAIAFLAPVLACVSLSFAHNLAAGDTTLISANGGINFYFGNHERASGINMSPDPEIASLERQRPVARERAERAEGREMTDAEVSRWWFGQGLRFIRDDPASYLALAGRKLKLAVSDLEADIGWSSRAEAVYSRVLGWLRLPYSVLLGLGLAGLLLRARRDRRIWIPALFVASTYAVLLLFFMGARFRVGAAPHLAVLAAGMAAGAAQALRDRGRVRLALAAGTAIALPVFGSHVARTAKPSGHALPMADVLLANATLLIGEAHEERGELAAARDAFRRAVEHDPLSFKGWLWLGSIAMARANAARGPELKERRRQFREEAREALLRSRALFGSYAPTHYLLGRLCQDPEDRRPAEALEHMQAAYRLDPGNPEIRIGLVEALIDNSRYLEARGLIESMPPPLRRDPRVRELSKRVGLTQGLPSGG